jgi:hypothetical protein
MASAKRTPVVQHHPKAPHASLDKLRRLSGVVALNRPVADRHLLDETDAERPAPSARD